MHSCISFSHIHDKNTAQLINPWNFENILQIVKLYHYIMAKVIGNHTLEVENIYVNKQIYLPTFPNLFLQAESQKIWTERGLIFKPCCDK